MARIVFASQRSGKCGVLSKQRMKLDY